MVYIQHTKHGLHHAHNTAPTRQHERDLTDQQPWVWNRLYHDAGVDDLSGAHTTHGKTGAFPNLWSSAGDRCVRLRVTLLSGGCFCAHSFLFDGAPQRRNCPKHCDGMIHCIPMESFHRVQRSTFLKTVVRMRYMDIIRMGDVFFFNAAP